MGDHVTVRTMSRDEFGAMRELSIAAFGADHAPDIGQLLDALHASGPTLPMLRLPRRDTSGEASRVCLDRAGPGQADFVRV